MDRIDLLALGGLALTALYLLLVAWMLSC